MACRCDKQKYPTREEALEAQKHLVWLNHARGDDAKSAGLNTYPCPDDPSAWHVGHSSLQTPICYHYDVVAALDRIVRADALAQEKPRRLSKEARRKYSGVALALFQQVEERAPLAWFTWSATWDFQCLPHPGAFESRPGDAPDALAAHVRSGVVRISVPASVAKLRWSDWLTANHTPRFVRDATAERGNPAQWLATDQPVPASAFRSIDVWYRDRWVDAAELPDDFDAWLAEPLAVTKCPPQD